MSPTSDHPRPGHAPGHAPGHEPGHEPGREPGHRPPVPRLHVLTDEHRAVLPVVDAALAAGTDGIQVRIEQGTDRARLALTEQIVARCRAAGTVCLVNDRVDLALATGADGVHLGADDLPIAVARRLLGPTALIGATARDPQTARALVAEGADYLGVGPVHATTTKTGLPAPLGPAGVAAVAAAVDVPVIAIAGLDATRAPAVLAAGAHGIAVVGAVSAADDPAAATRTLLAVLAAHPPGRPAVPHRPGARP